MGRPKRIGEISSGRANWVNVHEVAAILDLSSAGRLFRSAGKGFSGRMWTKQERRAQKVAFPTVYYRGIRWTRRSCVEAYAAKRAVNAKRLAARVRVEECVATRLEDGSISVAIRFARGQGRRVPALFTVKL